MNKNFGVLAIIVLASVYGLASCSSPENGAAMKAEMIEGIGMVTLPAGSFHMGSDYGSGEDGGRFNPSRFQDEAPVHTVNISSFQIGATEITQAQYSAVMGENPSGKTVGDDYPVTDLGASHALLFCNKLSEAAGYDPAYDEKTGKCDLSKNGFRLPTDAEWEYACRAGSTTNYNTGDTADDLDRAGWYIANSDGKLQTVAQKEPNAWGLHDMHGNVWEFCYDGYDEIYHFGNYPSGESTDPILHEEFNLRIMRGGGWFNEAPECRSAVRGNFWTGGGSRDTGFRVARSLR